MRPAEYPLQTGTMHVALISRHRTALLAVAGALEDCCWAVGETLVRNAPVRCVSSKLHAGCNGVTVYLPLHGRPAAAAGDSPRHINDP
jgi:hypothetical protein